MIAAIIIGSALIGVILLILGARANRSPNIDTAQSAIIPNILGLAFLFAGIVGLILDVIYRALFR